METPIRLKPMVSYMSLLTDVVRWKLKLHAAKAGGLLPMVRYIVIAFG